MSRRIFQSESEFIITYLLINSALMDLYLEREREKKRRHYRF
jgi:hypothetical protein